MSGILNLSLSDDMPDVSVEVVSPDLQVVARVALGKGRPKTVNVPSEGSFLRVHLPSGRIVTLTDDRGQLTRLITRQSLETAESARSRATLPPVLEKEKENFTSLADISQYHIERSVERDAPPSRFEDAGDDISLNPESKIRVYVPGGSRLPGVLSGREAAWALYGNTVMPPYRMEIFHPWGQLDVSLPGNARTVYARSDAVSEGSSTVVSIRLATGQPLADTILNYFSQGNLYAAETMTDWIDEAEDMLQSKVADPYSAAVGGYLLLKLKRFDRLHTWPKNLADWFTFLPDGCVIWAWQQIHDNPGNENQIRSYLIEAANRGLPVYSEGLRLLLDGLRLFGDAQASEALETLLNKTGSVVWSAPISTTSHFFSGMTRTIPVLYDIGFMASA